MAMVALGGGGSALAVAAPHGRAVARPAGPAFEITVLPSTSRTLLRTGYVRIRVRASRPVSLRVGAPGTRTRLLRFTRRGTRTLSLALGAATRRRLNACRRTRVIVRGALVVRRRARGVVVRSRMVAADATRCARRPAGNASAGTPKGGGTGSGGGSRPGAGGGSSPGPGGDPSGPGGGGTRTEAGGGGRCDPLDGAVCLQPWPNDYFTRSDSATVTKRRLDLRIENMPRNVENKPIDPTDMNRADGFSPGNMIITKVPGLGTQAALDAAGAVGIKNMDAYDDANQPIVVIDAATGQRQPIWAEIDSNPVKGDGSPNEASRNVIIRPARNLLDGHRYIVALRGLRNDAGQPVGAQPAFRIYRDHVGGQPAEVEARRPHMEELFATLQRAGIARNDLYLAWDFTVASTRSLVEDRMLTIRNDAFAKLGDGNLSDMTVQGNSPQFSIKAADVEENPDGPTGKIARRINGTVSVPCYLFQSPPESPTAAPVPDCRPGATFLFLPVSDQPVRSPVPVMTEARFTCQIPRTAFTDGPSRVALYGHGLFGSRAEVGQGQLKDLGGDYNITFCATDWIGMACPDLPSTTPSPPSPQTVQDILSGKTQAPTNCDLPVTLTILKDLSNFPKLVDRLQQGFVNFLYVGRAMIHPSGFASNAAFKKADGSPLIQAAQPNDATPRLFYDGNSQGGIFGGALAAIAPDYNRATLGVPGMNYSTLLRRSVDFDAYATGKFRKELPDTPLGLYDNYPNELERPLNLSLIQLLWDRADPNGYANHMTGGSPLGSLPNTPDHEVMLHAAFGDHQVANVAAEVEARTIGARTIEPYLDPPSRSPYSTATPFGIQPITAFPFAGSAIVMWDSGSPTPPTTNTPPRAGRDPHSDPRSTPAAREMKSWFLSAPSPTDPNLGKVVNTCARADRTPRACYAVPLSPDGTPPPP